MHELRLHAYRFLRSHLFILILLVSLPSLCKGQEEKQEQDFLNYSAPLETGETAGSVGLSVTVLPQLLVEDELRQSPLLQGRLRYGLPENFSLVAGLNTNVITTLGSLEGRWNLKIDRAAFGLSDRFAYWYGFARFEGFDIDVTSWLNYPGLEVGYRVGDVLLTSRAELQMVTSLSVRTDGIRTDSTSNYIAGYAVDLHVEQPFWGNTSVDLGLRLNYSRSLYQAWLAFSSFQEYLLFPEFSISLLL